MTPMFEYGDRAPDLQHVTRWWTIARPSWHLRLDAASDNGLGLYFARQRHRVATVEEVATSLLEDPQVRSALTALASPAGAAIEQTVLGLWLPEWQAKLLTEALTQAWKIVIDDNRPAWQRLDVLAGVVLVLAAVGLLAGNGRRGLD